MPFGTCLLVNSDNSFVVTTLLAFECRSLLRGVTVLPEGVVNGEDSEPDANYGDGQKNWGGKRLGDVSPTADAPKKLLHERDIPP